MTTGVSSPTETPRNSSTPRESGTPTEQPTTPTFKPHYDNDTPSSNRPLLPAVEALSLDAQDWPSADAAEQHRHSRRSTSTPRGASTPTPGSPRLEWQPPTTNPGAFPPELISLITQHLYYSFLPPPEPFPDPDPYLHLLPRTSPHLPPRFASPMPDQAREALRSLALVDKTWGEEATRTLWRKLSFGMPRAWESVLRLVEEYNAGRRIKRASRWDPSRSAGAGESSDAAAAAGGSGWSIATIGGSGAGLYSPPIDSPGVDEIRGRAMEWLSEGRGVGTSSERRTMDDGQAMMIDTPTAETSLLESFQQFDLPTLNPIDSPLLHTKSISFSRFRTAGMNRSVRQGSHERFITPYRLLTLLRGTRLGKGPLEFPGAGDDEEEDSIMGSVADEEDEVLGSRTRQKGKLEAIGFTEFMDSALTKPVLDELLFRGGYLAEYEEPAEDEEAAVAQAWIEQQLSDTEMSLPSPSPSPFSTANTPLPPLEPFHARHLQSSHSRSPMGHRRSSLSSSVAENSGEDDMSDDEDDGERREKASGDDEDGGGATDTDTSNHADDDDDEDDGHHRGGRDGSVRGRSHISRAYTPRFPLHRRSSGSAFASRPRDPTTGGEDESEERGRDRKPLTHRSSAPTDQRQAASGRRFNRSSLMPIQPPSSGGAGGSSSRSVSVPAAPYAGGHGHGHGHGHHQPAHGHSHTHGYGYGNYPRGQSLDTERSSSVPASVSGRRRGGAGAGGHGGFGIGGPVKIVQTLEGSTDVKAIRALDLCGCVSRNFIASLEECIETYKLGPPSLLPSALNSLNPIHEYDSDDDAATEASSSRSLYSHAGDERRKLRRVFFPHLRRLGLSSSLLPSNLLTSFVLAFPYLTHLDLAHTLTSPMLLKHLALAGQSGPGGRKMRLRALNLARCRLMTGAAIVGLLCGDCPPFTSMAGMEADEQWGSGEVVADLTDLSLFGDGTYPSPLSQPELRLVISISPAFTSGLLRYLDLSSTPMTDAFLLEHFPRQPHLLELGLANCRGITMRGVAQFLVEKAPGVEVLDLSNSAPAAVQALAPSSASRRRVTNSAPTLSVMELHMILLKTCASVDASHPDPESAQVLLALRATHLRVVELDEKTLEALQGGAGDWKPIWGKGRRGWYVDIGTHSALNTNPLSELPRKLVHDARDSPRRMALQRLYESRGSQPDSLSGWHSRKMSIIRPDGMMGKEDGLYAYHSFASG